MVDDVKDQLTAQGYTANLKQNDSKTMISMLNCVVCKQNSSASLKSETS